MTGNNQEKPKCQGGGRGVTKNHNVHLESSIHVHEGVYVFILVTGVPGCKSLRMHLGTCGPHFENHV